MSDEDHLLCARLSRITSERVANNRRIGADAKTGAVFCVECNDFVYDRELEETRRAAVLSAEERETRFQCEYSISKRSSYSS
jgi:ubiquitin carboxyl-terminal hydrolase 22/27/51